MYLPLKVGALALASLSLAADLPPNSTPFSDGIPPVRYQNDNVAVVYFLDDVGVACGYSTDPQYVIVACAQEQKIAMPNPCKLADKEVYARILCHELAHVNGWPGTHGD